MIVLCTYSGLGVQQIGPPCLPSLGVRADVFLRSVWCWGFWTEHWRTDNLDRSRTWPCTRRTLSLFSPPRVDSVYFGEPRSSSFLMESNSGMKFFYLHRYAQVHSIGDFTVLQTLSCCTADAVIVVRPRNVFPGRLRCRRVKASLDNQYTSSKTCLQPSKRNETSGR